MWTILKFSPASSSSSSSPQIRFRVFCFSFFVADHIAGGGGIDSVTHRHPIVGEAAAHATSPPRRTTHVGWRERRVAQRFPKPRSSADLCREA